MPGPPGQNRSIPQQIKAGYQKAIELAPRAVEQMEQAVKSLKQKDPQAAYQPAEEARKILEEIQKAQPKQDQDQKTRTRRSRTSRRRSRRRRTSRRRTSRRRTSRRRSREEGEQKKEQEQKKQEKSEQVRSAEIGSEAATAASLARSDRRGAAQGPRTAAGKARTRPHDEGPRVRQGSRGEGLVMRHANRAMTGLAGAGAPSRRAGQRRRRTGNRRSRQSASEIFIGESVDYVVEIRNVRESGTARPVGACARISTSSPPATSHVINRPSSSSTAGSASRTASVMPTDSA